MKTTRIGSLRQTETSLSPLARRVGSIIAYAGVPASTLAAVAGVLNTVNVLTSFYLVAISGVVASLRGAKVRPSLLRLSYFLLAWYVVLLAIELTHGGPFRYPLPRGANFLTDYFPLVALPFFVIGLQETKAEFRVFEWVAIATIVFSAGLVIYQFFVVGDVRPRGFSLNPIPFALIVLTWSLFLFSRALQVEKVDWLRFVAALVGLVPILFSGSKLAWICAALGYSALFAMWVVRGRRWKTLAVVIVGLVPVFWLLWRVETLRSRVTEFVGDFGAYLNSGDTSGPTFGLRLGAIISGYFAFLDRPFLGYGLAEGKTAALEHRPPSISSFAQLPHLHSDYVTHLVAFGALGPVFLIWLFVMFMVVSSRPEDVAIRRFGIMSGIIFLMYMAVEVVFTQPELYGLVFFLFGLILLAPEGQQAGISLRRWPWRSLASPFRGSAAGRQ